MRNNDSGDKFWDELLSGDQHEQIQKLAEMAAHTRLETGDLYRVRERQVGKEIKAQRINSGLSQSDLAKRMSELGFQMEQSTIAKIENGNRPFRLAELFALSGILNVPETAFLTSSIGEDADYPEDHVDILRQLLEIETNNRDRTREIMMDSLETGARMFAEAEASIRWTSGQIRFAAANAMKSAHENDEPKTADGEAD
ncbi:helix-turn-helix domain-containing protein [Cryobacterium sinapicolor]|nr:helix-turn-helix transcriptional regulator [Cryobacterium sinapicolor]